MPIASSQRKPRAKPGESSVHLDQTNVAKLTAPEKGSRLVLDDEIPGFCLQITYTGTRTFRLRYRRGGKWYSVKIGRWRDGKEPARAQADGSIGKSGLTAAQARAKAADLRRLVDKGENPALEAKLKEAEQSAASAGLVTVRAAYAQYLAAMRARRSPMKASSLAKVEGNFEKHILPRLGGRYLSSLTPDDVRMLVQEVQKPRQVKGRRSGGPVAANRVVAHLSAFLTWCTKRNPPMVVDNVAKRIDRQEVLAPETKRERYLTREEWAAVMHELDEWPHWATRGSRYAETKTVRLDEPQLRQLVSCEALRVALLTGSRKGETLAMRWADVDLDAGWWIKPAATTKGGKAHEIALQSQVVESLRKLQAAHGDPVFVFPGKARLDKIISGGKPRGEEGGPVKDVHELWGRIRAKLGMEDVRIHDLRHTTASVLISAGADLYSVGQQLGHKQAQTTQRYAHLYEERKRALADMIETFARGNPSKPQAGGDKPAKRPNRVR